MKSSFIGYQQVNKYGLIVEETIFSKVEAEELAKTGERFAPVKRALPYGYDYAKTQSVKCSDMIPPIVWEN